MNLFEYQAKTILRRKGLPVPRGYLVRTPSDAHRAALTLGGPVVLKAQIRAGGRGKAGGVKFASTAREAETTAREMLGMTLRDHLVRCLLVEEAVEIEQEFYVAVTLDRLAQADLFMLSPRGGVEVERIAREDPDSLAQVHVDPLMGWGDHIGRTLCAKAGVSAGLVPSLTALLKQIWDAYLDIDAMLLEINPLALCSDGQFRLVDAKATVDDAALHRHPLLKQVATTAADDPQETRARELGLTYVKLGGDIGVIGNGAGLVMSTLDLVGQMGGRPADFLDLGGGAKADEVAKALALVASDPEVRSIFVNVLGGITRCDEVAQGVLTCIDQLGLDLPVVLRLAGTNEARAKELVGSLGGSRVRLADDMVTGARMAVACGDPV